MLGETVVGLAHEEITILHSNEETVGTLSEDVHLIYSNRVMGLIAIGIDNLGRVLLILQDLQMTKSCENMLSDRKLRINYYVRAHACTSRH